MEYSAAHSETLASFAETACSVPVQNMLIAHACLCTAALYGHRLLHSCTQSAACIRLAVCLLNLSLQQMFHCSALFITTRYWLSGSVLTDKVPMSH